MPSTPDKDVAGLSLPPAPLCPAPSLRSAAFIRSHRVAMPASAFLPALVNRDRGPHVVSPASLRVVPCLHFSPAAADARVRWRRHPRPVAFFFDARRSSRRFLAQVSLENRPDPLRALSALRPPVSPLHLPLSAGLSCRHGTTRCRNLMNLWRLLCIMPVKPC